MATAQPTAVGEEALACVALEEQALVLVAQLVPQGVELAIVPAVNDVGEFVEHSVRDLLAREELVPVAGVAEAEEDLLTAVDVEAWHVSEF